MSESSCRRALILILAWGLLGLAGSSAQSRRDKQFGRPHIDAVKGAVKVIDVRVVDFGKVIYKGRLDLNPTLKRIREGRPTRHRNDGVIFLNREGKLPRHRDREYYREFVVQKKGLPFPGPQRLIIGKKGEVSFSGDHYKTFIRVPHVNANPR